MVLRMNLRRVLITLPAIGLLVAAVGCSDVIQKSANPLSPTIAVELATHPTVEVIIVGGRLFKHSVVASGAAAAEAAAQVTADLFLMGVTGVRPDTGLTTGDVDEAAMKRALSRRAAQTWVMASEEKIGAASPFRVLRLDEVAGIVTRLDPSDGHVVETFTVSPNTREIDAGEGGLWMLDVQAGTVTLIDETRNQSGGPIAVGPEPSQLSVGLGAVWVASLDGTLHRVNPLTSRDEQDFDLGAPLSAIAVDPTTRTIWLTVESQG